MVNNKAVKQLKKIRELIMNRPSTSYGTMVVSAIDESLAEYEFQEDNELTDVPTMEELDEMDELFNKGA